MLSKDKSYPFRRLFLDIEWFSIQMLLTKVYFQPEISGKRTAINYTSQVALWALLNSRVLSRLGFKQLDQTHRL